MSISAISAAMSASYMYGSNSALNKTLDKLLEQEESATEVLKSATASSKVKVEETEDADNQDNGQSSDLRDRAEKLAEKLGIKIDNNDTIDEILADIQDVIDKLFDEALRNNDEGFFDTVKGYQSELDILVEENNGGSVAQQIVYSFMDMIAEQNKYALGINQQK